MENHYLDKDYEQLMNDSSIDPESPEVLYARSQCLKIGKGVAKDYTKYLELLHEAAEAERTYRTGKTKDAGDK